jgi:hypothetical protein
MDKNRYSPTVIKNLFLFNSTWGPKEGDEEKKIIYFWPEDCNDQSMLKKIGLVEGVIIFSGKFSDKPATSLHTLKERTVFFEAEKDYWLCITVSVPSTRKQGKDGGETIEFHPEDVSDIVLRSLISRSYQMFRLFHSSLAAALDQGCGGSKTIFKELVKHFFSRYLATLRVENGDITTTWGGIQYLALDSSDFLRVQSFINRMKEEHNNIRKCLFLQSGQLVWSGVEPGQTKLLVQYLSTTILPMLPSISRQPCGSFLVGEKEKAPVVYIGADVYHLAVFHAINTTICLLLTSSPPKSFFDSFSQSVGESLGNLSADLTHAYVSKPSSSPSTESLSFIYFNASNLAIKSTVTEGHAKLTKIGADFIEDLCNSGCTEGEIMAKTWTEEWVVVQVAGARTIVVLLHDKNLNLMEVSESVSRLEKTRFDSICML